MSAITQKPIKVLVFAHDAGLGGAQRSLLEILERLNTAAYRPVVVAPTPGPFVKEVRKQGFPCYWGIAQRWIFFKKPMGPTTLVKRPWRLLTHPYFWAMISLATLPLRVVLLALLAKREGADLIYSNTITLLDGALVARLLGIPHVWHLRESVAGNPYIAFPFPVFWVPKLVLEWSDRVIVNSDALRKALFGNAKHSKIRVIRNGVRLDAIHVQLPRPDLPLIPPNTRLTAICGNLHQGKGIHVYLSALARLKQAYPDVHHLVIGTGQPEYEAALHQETEKLGLTRQVHFLGDRRDVRELLIRSEVLVSASFYESFGRTLIEAMALGVPVIATRSGGPEEIIEDGKSGYLVDIGDAEALADRMSKVIGNRELAVAMGETGRQRVRKLFAIEKTVANVEGVFSEILERKTINSNEEHRA